MGYHFYNPHENKVSVARHAELFENILKCPRSEWESHSSKTESEWCATPGTKSIWNSTCRIGGNPGKSSGKNLRKVPYYRHILKSLPFRLILYLLFRNLCQNTRQPFVD
ncbi:hypothetical protein Tco_0893127 [Tanacetum coccineum]|uniref:Uncharacterized protein n=1 Tax=Tanacetum coccineum TaxID=301880 RepID=A0ABQ5C7Y3_9ASTR